VRDEEEVAHLTKVLRLPVGAEVEATDGRGNWCVGRLAAVGSREAAITAETEGYRASHSKRLVLALGALKHGAFDEILPGLVELGVDQIRIFLQEGADRTRIAPKAVDRWARIARQALKQCKRVHLPEIAVHGSLAALLTAVGEEAGLAKLVLEPSADQGLLSALGAGFAPAGATGVVLVVGGEQGLSAGELGALRSQGFIGTSCGDGILRAVTAALAAVAAAALVRGSEPC
jgi:16S rRNA (uracil1498-N3)-methyltransferase